MCLAKGFDFRLAGVGEDRENVGAGVGALAIPLARSVEALFQGTRAAEIVESLR